MTQVLTEKYRPKKFDELVFVDDNFKKNVQKWITQKHLDGHILLYGKPGTGKSSLINVIINELGLKDYMRVNVSNSTSIDDMRKVIEYASVPPFNNDFKLVILEEFERASKQAQDSLKYILEQYVGWCIFIFTTNEISKVSDAIQSRCQLYHFNKVDIEGFILRMITILNEEKITFTKDILVKYVQTYYPDLRACINSIAQHINNNVLEALGTEQYSVDKFVDIIKALNSDTIYNVKKMIVENISNEDYILFYQFLYNHLEMITDKQSLWDDIILKISEYLYKHETIAYPDINLMACLIEIKDVLKKC